MPSTAPSCHERGALCRFRRPCMNEACCFAASQLREIERPIRRLSRSSTRRPTHPLAKDGPLQDSASGFSAAAEHLAGRARNGSRHQGARTSRRRSCLDPHGPSDGSKLASCERASTNCTRYASRRFACRSRWPMRCRLRPCVPLGYTVCVVNDVATASRAVRCVLICCVVAMAVSCGQSGQERRAAEIGGSSMAPASVTEPTSKNEDTAALVRSREEGQLVLAKEAEQRLYSSTTREPDIIARMVSRNVSYSDFLRDANVVAHPQPSESPEVWLTIADNPEP